MTFTASKLIEYARSLSDLQNSRFITYEDEVTFLNEAYRDIYNLYTESSGDYYTKDLVFELTGANLDPTSLGGGEYLYPLPTDFYKIRLLSFNNGDRWQPCMRFSTSERDTTPTLPKYRLKNNNLWLLVPNGMSLKFKMTYYIPPQTVTLPNYNVSFLENTPVYQLSNIAPGFFVEEKNLLIYVEDTAIKVDDKDSGDIRTLYNSVTAITNLVTYYGGYIYWISAVDGQVYRAPTDFISTLVPVALPGALGVTSLNIQNGNLYYSTLTDTYQAELDGTSAGVVLASDSVDYQLLGNTPLYISAGTIWHGTTDTTVPANRVFQYGGRVYYTNNTNRILELNMVDYSSGVVIQTNSLFEGFVNENGYLPIRTDKGIIATSLVPDTVFDYPTNEVNEIIAYVCAISFSRKQNDQAKQAALTPRLDGLMTRFANVNKRDEYQFFRINNDIRTVPLWF